MDGFSVEECRHGAGELEPTIFAGHRLALQLNGPVPLEFLQGGQYRPLTKEPGRFAVTPAGATVGLRRRSEIHFLLVTIDPNLVARILAEAAGDRTIELIERHGCDDPHARHLLLALQSDIAAGNPSGRLYTDALIRTLVLRLLADYTDHDREPSVLIPEAVRRVRDYVEAHLADNPSLADLAAVAGLSPHHFARTFARTTGLSPHQYLIARRLERAKSLLLGSKRPIVTIALDLGFGSQGHFHRAFRKHVGTTPGTYRRDV